ncbi:MAG: acetolactate synthase large subunit, partial [Deltaproteobacteria bacterium]
SIQKNVPVTVPIVVDCKIALSMLNNLLDEEGLEDVEEIRKEWLEKIEDWKKSKPLTYKQEKDEIKPQYVIETLYHLTKGEAIVATEVGQNQMWTAQFYKFHKPNHFITSGGLGCMGYGFPASIGAKVACPDKIVVDIAGDGSIQMNIQELATAVQNNIHVKVIILNNSYLGMVRQWQELFYEKRYSHTYLSYAPDFVKLAEAYGAVGMRVTKPEEVKPALEKALSTENVGLVDIRRPPEEKVFPMVPAGSPITEMILV